MLEMAGTKIITILSSFKVFLYSGAKGEGLYFNTDRDAYTEKKVTNGRLKYQ